MAGSFIDGYRQFLDRRSPIAGGDLSARQPKAETDIARHMREDDENPDVDPGTFIEDLPPSRIREQIGMAQVEFAGTLGIPVATLQNWEQGRVRIDSAVRALFCILSRDPKHTLKALAPVSTPDRKAG